MKIMGKACLFILFLITALAPMAEAAPRKTVVDYYNMTVDAGDAIALKGGKWMVRGMVGEFIPVPVVDIKKGYIKMTDYGTGGGTTTREAALFTSKNDAVVLVVSTSVFEGTACSLSYSTRVFELKNGKMAGTGSLLPILPMDPFFKTGFDFFDKEKIGSLADTMRISYRLPRVGTSIKAVLEMDCFEWRTAQGDPTPEEKKQAENFLGGVKRKVIDINWDMDKGRFIVDDK
jgi:hypothetical protein